VIHQVGGVHFFPGKISGKEHFPEFFNHVPHRDGKMNGFITDMGKTGIILQGSDDLFNGFGQ
jgi:hypothetical protein